MKIETLPIEDRIYNLRVEGYNAVDIGRQVNMPVDEVEKIINSMAEKSRRRLLSELSIAAIVEMDRMDLMIQKLLPLVKNGDIPAIDRLMAVSKERRKMLDLDRDNKLTTGGDTESVDLGAFTLAELQEWERLQKKLADHRKGSRPVKELSDSIEPGRRPRVSRKRQAAVSEDSEASETPQD